MAITCAELEQPMRQLSLDERARLAEVVLESLQLPASSGIEVEWRKEVANRVAAHDRGGSEAYPAQEALAEAKRIER